MGHIRSIWLVELMESFMSLVSMLTVSQETSNNSKFTSKMMKRESIFFPQGD